MQRLVDFAHQFDIVTGAEKVDGDLFSVDLFFFRGYLRDKLALHKRYPDTLADLGEEPAIAPALAPGAIVSDVGSVKAAVIEALAPHLPAGVHLVPGHPIAGTEDSGPEAGFDSLFEGRWFLITPPAGTDPDAVERVAELWRRAGSMIAVMDAGHHDLAITLAP